MSISLLQQQYTVQEAKSNKLTNSSNQLNGIQAIVDPRFNALINRPKRSNQITPESTNRLISPNTISTTTFDLTLQKESKQQCLSSPCKFRLQGSLIGLLTTAISISIILGVLLTRTTTTSSSSSTSTLTLSSCDTLQWDPVGITIFGNGSAGSSLYQVNSPRDIFIDSNDVVYIADTNNHRVLSIPSNNSGTQNATIVAGVTGVTTIGSNTLYQPASIHVDSQRNLYIMDSAHYRVQLWPYGASNGSTVADSSTGVSGSTLDKFGYSYAMYVDDMSNIYIADSSYPRVIQWPSGALNGTLVAGNGSSGYTSSQLRQPMGMVLDSKSNTLYINDYSMYTVVAWSLGATSGSIVAGMNSTQGNIPSLLYSPWDIIRDKYGNFYVSDCGNNRIEMFCATDSSFSSGTTIAGVGIGISAASARGLLYPTGIAFDSQMNLYVADYGHHRIQKFMRIS